MHGIQGVIAHIETYGRRHQALYLFALVIFFWAIFDGMSTYITPLVLTEGGLSKTAMGLIYASSSVFGAIFDFLVCKFIKNSYYRRMFLFMFGLCFIYLLTLTFATTIFLFLAAMMFWGIFYDLKNFGADDFVARFTRMGEHSASTGLLSVFQAGGYLLAPILAGFLIGDSVGLPVFITAGVFLIIAFSFFLLLLSKEKNFSQENLPLQYSYRGLFSELKLWRRMDKVLLPVLVMTAMLNIVDAFFWTVGPLLAESFTSFHQFAGLMMTAYELPALLMGWFTGTITRKFGKKRTSFYALLLGSLVLTLIGFLDSPILITGTIFLASLFLSLAWPALRSAFVDYVDEAANYEKEIVGLEDLYTNLGYVIGPALAGILADNLGNTKTFTVLGLIGAAVAIYLIKITPRKIKVLNQLAKTP